ncbi:MAG: hypothetical protein H6523_13165 [Mycolicibacterium sp.]|nr:hypothetical protein [Mycolicibacterium sp.]
MSTLKEQRSEAGTFASLSVYAFLATPAVLMFADKLGVLGDVPLGFMIAWFMAFFALSFFWHCYKGSKLDAQIAAEEPAASGGTSEPQYEPEPEPQLPDPEPQPQPQPEPQPTAVDRPQLVGSEIQYEARRFTVLDDSNIDGSGRRASLVATDEDGAVGLLFIGFGPDGNVSEARTQHSGWAPAWVIG